MKQYDTYKPSGIEWLGDIPDHWEVKRVKEIFRNTGSGTTPPSGDQTYYDDNGFNWLQTGDLNDSFITETSKKVSQKAIEEFSTLKKYRKNSLVIAMYGATIGKMGYLNIDTTTNQACCVLTNSKGNNSQYLFYQLLSMKQFIISLSTGGGQPNINQDIVRLLRLCVPDLHEQTAIANYLDTKTTAIDRKIELLTAKADKYKALRRSLINETVCRGLNPNAPLKDSGIEWVGMIPEHWEVKRVKEIFYIGRGRVIGQDELVDEGRYPVFSSQTENNGCLGYIDTFDFNTTLLTWTTDGANAGTLFKREGKFNCTNVCGTLKPKKRKENLDFILYVLQIAAKHNKRIDTNGAKIMNNEMSVIPLLYPPKEEQEAIAQYLNEKTTQIETILTNISEQKTKLTQLRKTLINDVVTGKIKVTE